MNQLVAEYFREGMQAIGYIRRRAATSYGLNVVTPNV
jgi:ABC-type amino acid transport system permease subunit